MRFLMILWATASLFFTTVPAMADQAEDEAAIRKATEQFFAAENNKDADALAALVVEDYETWTGVRQGREGYKKRMAEIFAHRTDIQVGMLDEIGIVWVTPDVAIHKFTFANKNWPDADGNPTPPGKGLQARVYVRQNGKWLLAVAFRRPIEE